MVFLILQVDFGGWPPGLDLRMRDPSLVPRAEMRLRRAGWGTDLILKYERRLTRRSHPAPLPPYLCLASLPPISAFRLYPAPVPLHTRVHEKPPALPHWGKDAEGFLTLSVTALSHAPAAITQATVTPWVPRSAGTPVRVRAARCRARVRCRGLRTGETHPRARRAGSAAWRSSRA